MKRCLKSLNLVAFIATALFILVPTAFLFTYNIRINNQSK